ncbi:hypothetical protein [Raoultella planticola]|uniref:hypothetical protein n=1 Tax=Raoultella planticola TaxID=575 RepID=UPI00384B1649
MYELTKIYKTKAMAVNAIRMTATNKGWKVLSTEDAAQHVWPQAEGFTVNNTSLNLALGFISEADADALSQRVPEGSVTDGKALEAVNAALSEQAHKDAKEPLANGKFIGREGNAYAGMEPWGREKLQKPSKLEESKKENAKERSQRRQLEIHEKLNEAEPKAQTRCNVVNGARRPLRGKTLLVWETTERMNEQMGRVPSLKEVHEELCRMYPDFNKTTAGIQYYACRAYNGWASDKK